MTDVVRYYGDMFTDATRLISPRENLISPRENAKTDHDTIKALNTLIEETIGRIKQLKAETDQGLENMRKELNVVYAQLDQKEEYINRLKQQIETLHIDIECRKQHIAELQTERQADHAKLQYTAAYTWQDAASNWHRSTPSPIQSKPTSLLGIGVLAGLGALLTASSKPTDVRVPETNEDASNEPIEAANTMNTEVVE